MIWFLKTETSFDFPHTSRWNSVMVCKTNKCQHSNESSVCKVNFTLKHHLSVSTHLAITAITCYYWLVIPVNMKDVEYVEVL